MKLERTVRHTTKFGGRNITYTALDEPEAKAAGLEYRYWKDIDYVPMAEGLFYILSDDKMVVPIFCVGYGRTGFVLRSAFGNFIINKHYRRDTTLFVLPENRSRPDEFRRKYRLTPQQLKSVVATFAARGMEMLEIIDTLCLDKGSPKARTIKKFYMSEECTHMVREEVRAILTKVGITEEKVIQMLMDAHQTAKDKRDVSNMLRSVENLIDIYGLKDKMKETQTRSLELGSEVEDLARLESVKEHLKLTQKTESE